MLTAGINNLASNTVYGSRQTGFGFWIKQRFCRLVRHLWRRCKTSIHMQYMRFSNLHELLQPQHQNLQKLRIQGKRRRIKVRGLHMNKRYGVVLSAEQLADMVLNNQGRLMGKGEWYEKYGLFQTIKRTPDEFYADLGTDVQIDDIGDIHPYRRRR